MVCSRHSWGPPTPVGRPVVLSPRPIQQRRQGARRLRGGRGRWSGGEQPRFWGAVKPAASAVPHSRSAFTLAVPRAPVYRPDSGLSNTCPRRAWEAGCSRPHLQMGKCGLERGSCDCRCGVIVSETRDLCCSEPPHPPLELNPEQVEEECSENRGRRPPAWGRAQDGVLVAVRWG